MPGPLPKPPAQRRRTNAPKSYGAATPTAAEAAGKPPTLGFRAHKLVTDFYMTLTTSVEAQYYSAADWHRVRLELFYLNNLLQSSRIGAQAWTAVQAGLNELLVSPAAKRRLGIEMRRPAVDEDEDAAVTDLAEYVARISG